MWQTLCEKITHVQLQISVGAVVLGLAALLLSGAVFVDGLESPTTLPEASSSQLDASSPATNLSALDLVTVDLQGAVARPGVYQLPRQSRMGELMKVAGGFIEETDFEWLIQNLNQAEAIPDKTKLYIPFIFQEDKGVNADVKTTTTKKAAAKK